MLARELKVLYELVLGIRLAGQEDLAGPRSDPAGPDQRRVFVDAGLRQVAVQVEIVGAVLVIDDVIDMGYRTIVELLRIFLEVIRVIGFQLAGGIGTGRYGCREADVS